MGRRRARPAGRPWGPRGVERGAPPVACRAARRVVRVLLALRGSLRRRCSRARANSARRGCGSGRVRSARTTPPARSATRSPSRARRSGRRPPRPRPPPPAGAIELAFKLHGGTLTDDLDSALALVAASGVPCYWQPPQSMPDDGGARRAAPAPTTVPAVHVFSWWPGSTRRRLRERGGPVACSPSASSPRGTRCSSSCPLRRSGAGRRGGGGHVARCCRDADAGGSADAALRPGAAGRARETLVAARARRGRAQRMGLPAARRPAASAGAGAARDRPRRGRHQAPCHRRLLGPRAARLDRRRRKRRTGRRVHARPHPARHTRPPTGWPGSTPQAARRWTGSRVPGVGNPAGPSGSSASRGSAAACRSARALRPRVLVTTRTSEARRTRRAAGAPATSSASTRRYWSPPGT